MRAALGIVAVFVAAPVSADRAPAPPRSPSHVRAVSDQLGVAWVECLLAHYPEDITPKTDKVAVTVAFQEAGRTLRADLTIELARLDGTRVAPTPAEWKLMSCVEPAVEARTFHRDGDGTLGPISISDPSWEYPIVDDGALGMNLAGRYVIERVNEVRSGCPHGGAPMTVTLDVTAGGRVRRFVATTPAGDPHPGSDCLSRALRRQLRFPAVGNPTQLITIP
jgi:hypothetical protein